MPLLRKHEGLVFVQVGVPREETPQEFLMNTTWRSVETLAEFSGDNWREEVIDPREEHLLAKTGVDHYYDASVQEPFNNVGKL